MISSPYSYQVETLGLPPIPKGKFNNWFSLVSYLDSLTENQKVEFLALWHSEIYNAGIATGEENMLDD